MVSAQSTGTINDGSAPRRMECNREDERAASALVAAAASVFLGIAATATSFDHPLRRAHGDYTTHHSNSSSRVVGPPSFN